MASLAAGDRVQVQEREVTADDERIGLYYSYFAGLTGTVDTVYGDGSVCINVDLEALSRDARDRHLAMQEAEKKKWLDGLSGEARNRLTPEQRQLKLSYKILVSKKDLTPVKGGGKPASKRSEKQAAPEKPASEDSAPSSMKGPARAPEPVEDAPEPKRVTAEDLAKAEEEYLKSLQNKEQ